MGLLKTTFLGALAAGNTVAAVGSFEAVNKMHADPNSTAVEIAQEIMYRPFDNVGRASLGDYSEANRKNNGYSYRLGEFIPPVGIDAKLCTFFGNVVNREKDKYVDNPITQGIFPILGFITTFPGSYVGSTAGAAVGAAGLHLDID